MSVVPAFFDFVDQLQIKMNKLIHNLKENHVEKYIFVSA
jgi:5-methylcytosine-specific restriction endonuclease McrBC GTP-binding regulatory subunit McrB